MTKIKGGIVALVLLVAAGLFLDIPVFDTSPSKGDIKKVTLTILMERQPVRIMYSLDEDEKGPFEPEYLRSWHRNVWVEPGTTIVLTAAHGSFLPLTCTIHVVGREGFADAQSIENPGLVRCVAVV